MKKELKFGEKPELMTEIKLFKERGKMPEEEPDKRSFCLSKRWMKCLSKSLESESLQGVGEKRGVRD